MAHDEVNEHNVYTCTGQPLPSDIANMVEWMLNDDFSAAYRSESQCYIHVLQSKRANFFYFLNSFSSIVSKLVL